MLPGVKVSAIQQVVKTRMHALEQFRAFSLGVAAVVILIGALVVFVTMMGSVNERTREIGIFRALGFRRGHVVRLILMEALAWLSLLSGLLGYLAGMGATPARSCRFWPKDHPHLIWNPAPGCRFGLLALRSAPSPPFIRPCMPAASIRPKLCGPFRPKERNATWLYRYHAA